MSEANEKKPEEPKADDGAGAIDGFSELLASMAEARRTFEEEHGELELSDEFKFPMEISAIKVQGFNGATQGMHKAGSMVRIRPVNSEKTYLGLYLGDMTREIMLARGGKSKVLMLTDRSNPAIWVFDLKKIVWGDSSWWGVVEKDEDIERLISDSDIQNVWYVKALKAMHEQEKKCPTCNGAKVDEGGKECDGCLGTGEILKEEMTDSKEES